jgi:RNA polymerase sigma-70 factor, ECF subfamily
MKHPRRTDTAAAAFLRSEAKNPWNGVRLDENRVAAAVVKRPYLTHSETMAAVRAISAQAVASGDADAAARQVTALFGEYSADAYRFAYSLTGTRQDADDVVQFVFMQAYRELVAGRRIERPRAWLMRGVKHRSLNVLRDHRETPVPADELYVEDAREGGTEAADLARSLRAMLWGLPEGQHQAFVLRYWNGLSVDEVATVLETSPAAVESMLVRARATLMGELEEGDPACQAVRERMAAGGPQWIDDLAHVKSCRRCRTAQTRLAVSRGAGGALLLLP